VNTRFPILRAAIAAPPTELPLQPYFLTPTAIGLLELFEPDSRRHRVAKQHCDSTLQTLYAGKGLGTKPKRCLTEEEIACVEAQAGAIHSEWQTVKDFFAEAGPEHVPHYPGELRQALAVIEPGLGPARRERLSPLAG
jgi:hypothetical protein